MDKKLAYEHCAKDIEDAMAHMVATFTGNRLVSVVGALATIEDFNLPVHPAMRAAKDIYEDALGEVVAEYIDGEKMIKLAHARALEKLRVGKEKVIAKT